MSLETYLSFLLFKRKVLDNGKNYSGLLTGTIGPILNQEKMLRWLNSQTQNDHISSFPMLGYPRACFDMLLCKAASQLTISTDNFALSWELRL